MGHKLTVATRQELLVLGACVQHALQLQLAELPGVHNRRWQAVKERVSRLRELNVTASWQSVQARFTACLSIKQTLSIGPQSRIGDLSEDASRQHACCTPAHLIEAASAMSPG